MKARRQHRKRGNLRKLVIASVVAAGVMAYSGRDGAAVQNALQVFQKILLLIQ